MRRNVARVIGALVAAYALAACGLPSSQTAPTTQSHGSEAAPAGSVTRIGAEGELWYSGAAVGGLTSTAEQPSEHWYTGAPMAGGDDADQSTSAWRSGNADETTPRGRSPRRRERQRSAPRDESAAEPVRPARRFNAPPSLSSPTSDSSHVGLQLGFGVPVPLGEPFGQDLGNSDNAPGPPFMLRLEYGTENIRAGVVLFPDVVDQAVFGVFLGAPFARFRLGPLHASIGQRGEVLFLPTGDDGYETIIGLSYLIDMRVRYPFLRWLSATAQVDGGGALIIHTGDRSKHFGGGLLFTFALGVEASF